MPYIIVYKTRKNRRKDTERFFDNFTSMVDTIEKIPNGTRKFVIQKLSFFTLLDTLSKCAYPNIRGRNRNQRRFKQFIKNFSDWPSHSKVSIPHVLYFLQEKRIMKTHPLRVFIENEIKKLKWTEINSKPNINDDFDLTILNQYWDNTIPGHLKNFTHLHRLWLYRNALVHEARILGYGIGDFGFNIPSYHLAFHTNNKKVVKKITLELVYPIPFFKELSLKSINNLKQNCLTNRINPYDRYDFDKSW